MCQRKNGKGSLHSSTVERGGARFSTVHWGAGSVIHVAMLISVSSVVKTTLGTGTTEFTAPPSLPGIGSTRRLDQGRSALMMRRWIHGPPLTKLPTQTAQRPVWKSWNEVPRDVDEVARHGPWFLEIFSGTARLTAAVRALGVPCLPPIDITVCQEVPSPFDVLDCDNWSFIMKLIACGAIKFIHFGTPCNSFSAARKEDGGPPPSFRKVS